MEFDLIPQIVIIFSAGIIIFILGKNIPKIKEMQEDDLLFENKNSKEKKKFSYLYGRLTRRIKRDNYQEKMALVWKWLEKSLRKIRIKFLKLDNKIVSVLERLKKKHTRYEDNGNGEFKTEEEINSEHKNINGSENGFVNTVEPEKNEHNNFKFSDLNNTAKKDNFANGLEDEPKISESVREEEKAEKEKHSEDKDKNEVKFKTEDEKEIGKNETKPDEKDTRTSKEKECIDLIFRSPKNIKAYWKLGIIYSRRRKYKDSISCFRQIIKIDPGYTKAKKKIIDLMKRMKRDKKTNKEK